MDSSTPQRTVPFRAGRLIPLSAPGPAAGTWVGARRSETGRTWRLSGPAAPLCYRARAPAGQQGCPG